MKGSHEGGGKAWESKKETRLRCNDKAAWPRYPRTGGAKPEGADTDKRIIKYINYIVIN